MCQCYVPSLAMPLWAGSQTTSYKVRVCRQSGVTWFIVDSVVLDMEQALRAAFVEVLPGVKIKYCGFHVSQATVRKWVSPSINLRSLLKVRGTGEELRRWMKSFPNLAYVPTNLVRMGFYALGRWITLFRGRHPELITQDVYVRIRGKAFCCLVVFGCLTASVHFRLFLLLQAQLCGDEYRCWRPAIPDQQMEPLG
jgi:hypothetical protein